ncbi:hypothetical protein HHX47_DHR1001779 [Lentinula edodes]|nr:hypothetical protein HHX47_DHR1001779 [Lentinula edodes]
MEIEVEEIEVQKESLFYAPLFEGLNSIMGADSAVKFLKNSDTNLLSEGDHSHYKADINGLLTKTTAVPPIAEGAEYECDVSMTGKQKKKSTPNTVDDNNKIIYFALSLSRACREELGYDPTVTRVQGKNRTGPRYLSTIDSKQYITTEAITVRKAKFLLGSATRVFKVQQFLIDEGDLDSEVKVINDYWLPEDSSTELETRSAIEFNVQKVNVVLNLDRSAFNRYFVKIEACEKVQVPSTTEKGQTPDSTSNFLRGQTLPSDVKRFTISTQSSTCRRVMSVSIPASIMMESGPERQQRQESVLREATAVHLARLYRRTYAPKVHCRQLSEYAGEPLHQITNWVIVLKAFESLIIALSYMHSAGFVHRDISAANVLVKDGNAKLIDLEYSKRIQPEVQPRSGTSDVKTGTQFFMPVEVIEGKYLFRPKKHVSKYNVGLLRAKKARDEVFSHIFIFEKHKEILDGEETMVDLVSESMPEILYSNWECALRFAQVVKEKYRALQQSLPIDFKNAFHPSLYSDWQQAFVHCATEGWAGEVTHRGRAKRPAESKKKSKDT